MAEKHPLYNAVQTVYTKAYDPTSEKPIEIKGTGNAEEIAGTQEDGSSIRLRRKNIAGEGKKKIFIAEIGYTATATSGVKVDYITRQYAAYREGAAEILDENAARLGLSRNEEEALADRVSNASYNLLNPDADATPPA